MGPQVGPEVSWKPGSHDFYPRACRIGSWPQEATSGYFRDQRPMQPPTERGTAYPETSCPFSQNTGSAFWAQLPLTAHSSSDFLASHWAHSRLQLRYRIPSLPEFLELCLLSAGLLTRSTGASRSMQEYIPCSGGHFARPPRASASLRLHLSPEPL